MWGPFRPARGAHGVGCTATMTTAVRLLRRLQSTTGLRSVGGAGGGALGGGRNYPHQLFSLVSNKRSRRHSGTLQKAHSCSQRSRELATPSRTCGRNSPSACAAAQSCGARVVAVPLRGHCAERAWPLPGRHAHAWEFRRAAWCNRSLRFASGPVHLFGNWARRSGFAAGALHLS